jgi:hypothetical protein
MIALVIGQAKILGGAICVAWRFQKQWRNAG